MNTIASAELLAEPFTRTSTSEGVQFWILATLAVLGALGVVCASRAVYSAIFLATTMIILAVFYLAEGAVFLGVVQVVVYTGAVMMLFLFVLMLVGVDSSESLVETIRGQRIAAMVVGVGFGILLIAGLGNAVVPTTGTSTSGGTVRGGFTGLDRANAGGNVQALAELIFVRYVWAFELTGALLITATIGAMVLAHRERFEPRKDQRALSEERFRDTAQLTPLPSPGVYARHNAVHLPAMLPDGSFLQSSVSGVVRRRQNVVEAAGSDPESGVTPTELGEDGER